MQRKIILGLCLLLPFAGLTQGKKKRSKKQPQQVVANSVTTGGNVDYKQPGSQMPPVRFVTLDGTVYDNKSLAGDGNLFLMFFNPTCDHCMEMTRQFQKHIYLFKKSKVVLVSGANMGEYLLPFNRDLNMAQFSSTFPVALDSSATVEKLFLYQSLPQINIYDHDRKLIRAFTGLSAIDSLRRYIE